MAFGGPFSGIVTVWLSMLGSLPSDLDQYTSPLALVMFLAGFLFLIVVVMMNLLIAIMSDSYERVREPRHSCLSRGPRVTRLQASLTRSTARLA